MLNHYTILKLNPNGMNENGEKYSSKEITNNYRKLALQYHPDHNPDPTDNKSFITITTSYEILIDPETRDAFDRDLESNPSAFFDKKHIFVNLNDEIPISHHDVDNTNLTMVPWKLTQIDLTQLIVNAEYGPEQILQIASENLVFAAAILENNQVLMLLTLSQHFELLFILCNKFINTEQARPNLIKELRQIPNAKQLIERLIKKEDGHNVAFVSACQKYPALANSFVQDLFGEDANKKSSPLSKTTLLQLNTIIPCAVDYLIEFYANHLTLTGLEYVLEVNSARKASILTHFYQKASPKFIKEWVDYRTLITQIEKEGIEALQKNSQLVHLYGTKTFSLYESLNKKIPFDFSKHMFDYTIFNILIQDETCESFTREYLPLQQEEFVDALQQILSSFSHSASNDFKFDFINTPVSELLLNQISFNDFRSFLKKISLNIIADQFLEKFINFILTRKDSTDVQPFFLQLLLQTDKSVYQCLQNNRALLIALLNNSYYQNEIATNKTLEKKLAITTAKFNFTDEIKMEYLSPSFSLIHGAALEFYRYKNSDLIIKQDEFFPLWEQTGFFEDLLLIKTDHHDVDFFLLEAALSQLHHSSESKLLDEYPYLVTRLIKTLAKSSDMKATALLDLCRSSRLANLLINEIEREISTKYYPEGSIFNLAYLLIQNQLWADQYFTAGIANRWHEIFETEIFKKNVLKSWVIFEGIHYKDRQLVKSYSNNDEQHEQNFAQICHDFKTHLLPKYPRASFSRFLLLKESQPFQNALTAHEKLTDFLSKINGKPLTELDGNSTLEALLTLLHKTKLDFNVLSRVEVSLKDNAPELLIATLTMIEEDSRFHVPEYLQAAFKSCHTGYRLTQPLELIFLNVAKRNIEKYRHTISGDSLLAMYLAHGEEIMPFMTCYGLQDKLLVTEQLNRVLTKVKTGAHQFQTHEVDEQQLVRGLLEGFENIVNEAARDIQKIVCTNKIKEYYAELTTTIKKNNINDPHLNLLIDTFPREQNKNLLLWLVSLESKQDAFAKQTLLTYLSDPHLVANQDFIQHIDWKFLIEMVGDSTNIMLRIILNSVALCAKVNATPEFDTILDKINHWPDKTNDSFVMYLLLVCYSYIANNEFHKAYEWYDKHSEYLVSSDIKVMNELKLVQLRIDKINGALDDNKKKLNAILSEQSVDMQLEKLALLDSLQTEQQFPATIFNIETDLLKLDMNNKFLKKIKDELNVRLESVKASATQIGLDLQSEFEKAQRQQQYILLSKQIQKLGEEIVCANQGLANDSFAIDCLDYNYSYEENFQETFDRLLKLKQKLPSLRTYRDLFEEQHDAINLQVETLSELDSSLAEKVKKLSTNVSCNYRRCEGLNDQLEKTIKRLYQERNNKTDQNDPMKVKLIKEYMKDRSCNIKDSLYLEKIVNEVRFADLHAIFAKLAEEKSAPETPRYTQDDLCQCKREIYYFYYLESKRDNKRIAIAALLSFIPITWFVTIPYLAYKLYKRHHGIQVSSLDPESTHKIQSPRRYYGDLPYRSSHQRANHLFNKQGELQKEIYSPGSLLNSQVESTLILSTPQQKDRINFSLSASAIETNKIDKIKLKAKYDCSKQESKDIVRAHRV